MGSRNGGMRNFSMKKLGTPIGAGPASANENVGLSTVGVPSLARGCPLGSRLGLMSFLFLRGRLREFPPLPLGRGLAFSPLTVIGPVPCGCGAPPGFGASLGVVCWAVEVVPVLDVEDGA